MEKDRRCQSENLTIIDWFGMKKIFKILPVGVSVRSKINLIFSMLCSGCVFIMELCGFFLPLLLESKHCLGNCEEEEKWETMLFLEHFL